MSNATIRCGCGRTMTPDGRRGRDCYRCGCGVRITVALPQSTERRICWWADCRILAVTQEPLRLCDEHETKSAAMLAHRVGKGAIAGWLRARNEAPEGWFPSQQEPSKPPPPSVVYFMRRERLIKIGTTYQLRQRAQALGATVLASVPGGFAEEAKLHARFEAHRQEGEWFEPAPELVALINELRQAEGLPVITE